MADVAFVSSASGGIDIVGPDDIEGQRRIALAKNLKSAPEAKIHPSTTGEHGYYAMLFIFIDHLYSILSDN